MFVTSVIPPSPPRLTPTDDAGANAGGVAGLGISLKNATLQPPKRACERPRRVAKILSHSNLEVVSSFSRVGGDSAPSAMILEEEEGVIPPLYVAFQLSIEVCLRSVCCVWMGVCCVWVCAVIVLCVGMKLSVGGSLGGGDWWLG